MEKKCGDPVKWREQQFENTAGQSNILHVHNVSTSSYYYVVMYGSTVARTGTS